MIGYMYIAEKTWINVGLIRIISFLADTLRIVVYKHTVLEFLTAERFAFYA
jgi:hypothetical protein